MFMTVADRQIPPPVLTVESREAPDSPHAPLHAYERLEIRIEVHEGVVCVRAGDDESILVAGDSLTIAPGVAHMRWNGGDEDALFSETFRSTTDTTSGVHELVAIAAR